MAMASFETAIREMREASEADARRYEEHKAYQARVFNPDAPCCKCGSPAIALRLCECLLADPMLLDREHLHCTCTRCGYEYQALPLDADIPESPY